MNRTIVKFSKENLPADFAAPGGAAWGFFRKTSTTKALRIEGPFRVETSESENEPFLCEDGWLAIDARGYPYAIADDEFVQIYEPALPEGAAPGVPDQAWRGEEPAEGTRRSVIRDALANSIVGAHLSAPGVLQVADEIEIALQSSAEQPVMGDELAELDLNAVAARLQSLSDLERGQLMEKVGGAAGIVGSLVRQAAEQLEGFPADVKVPALLLLAAGIANQAGPTA